MIVKAYHINGSQTTNVVDPQLRDYWIDHYLSQTDVTRIEVIK